MKLLKCECCGGSLRSDILTVKGYYRCEYCGSLYKDDNESVIRIETYSNPIKTFKTSYELDENVIKSIGSENASEVVLGHLKRNLADAIAECMDVHTEYNPERMTQYITARVRMIDPKHRF